MNRPRGGAGKSANTTPKALQSHACAQYQPSSDDHSFDAIGYEAPGVVPVLRDDLHFLGLAR
ncbi:hypothetical protein A0H81_00175 [Grifola frondosa]|uniref:Uncharacterized protein n=1 Tax=Grifola frondosa TaxID=5627 RepID=A0A1C7MR03_GRIFR|nr:hypothetical protein A0H81_00175 [Grifola frondosa]